MRYELQDCFGSRLRRLSRITDSYFRKFLNGFGITDSQRTILFALNQMGKIEQGKIGDELVLERSTVSRNAKLLEKQGLIIRTAEYRPEIELTKKGKSLVKEIIPHWEMVMDELVMKLDHDGMKLIEELERKIN